jgi:hypothetical protein
VEKRMKQRSRKRLMVRYGVGSTTRTAFTQNVSESGLCIKTNQVYGRGSIVEIEIESDKCKAHLRGRVAWAKQVPPQLAHILGCGMGIRCLVADDAWLEFVRACQS